MIKCLLFLCVGLGVAFDATDCKNNGHETWMCDYMNLHNKHYAHQAEFILRKTKVSQSKEALLLLGQNYGLTSMSDKFHLRTNIALSLSRHKNVLRLPHYKHIRTSTSNKLPPIDWRNVNGRSYVTPVIDQGDCGDCFAFASATVLEYWLSKVSYDKTSVSSQFLMDCTSGSGRPNVGCDGGLMEYVFEFAKKHPVAYQRERPYLERQSSCPRKMVESHLKVKGYRVLMRDEDPNAEDQIEALLHKYGPVSIGIDSTSAAIANYRSGIFQARHCSKNIDHAVTIVGYTKDAWIIKNSWGPRWGHRGYLYLERGKNACGVAEYIVYITDATSVDAFMSPNWRYDA